MPLSIEIKEVMVYNQIMNTEDTLFKPIKWKKRLEQLFPQIPSRDDKKAYDVFLNRVYRNFMNHKNRKFEGKDCEFAWFYQIMKMANRRFREENIFICWLWLWITRSWEKEGFGLEWKGAGGKNFKKTISILDDLEDNFRLTFKSTKDFSGEKTIYRYRKDELVRANVIGTYTMGYSRVIRTMNLLSDSNRFLGLLKAGDLVTKREFQRKLRINSERLEELIKLDRESIKIVKFSKNSIGIIYKDTKKH